MEGSDVKIIPTGIKANMASAMAAEEGEMIAAHIRKHGVDLRIQRRKLGIPKEIPS